MFITTESLIYSDMPLKTRIPMTILTLIIAVIIGVFMKKDKNKLSKRLIDSFSKEFEGNENYKVLRNIFLQGKNELVKIECVILSKYGFFLVNALGENTIKIVGDSNDVYLKIGSKKIGYNIISPIWKNKVAIRAINYNLDDNSEINFYNYSLICGKPEMTKDLGEYIFDSDKVKNTIMDKKDVVYKDTKVEYVYKNLKYLKEKNKEIGKKEEKSKNSILNIIKEN